VRQQCGTCVTSGQQALQPPVVLQCCRRLHCQGHWSSRWGSWRLSGVMFIMRLCTFWCACRSKPFPTPHPPARSPSPRLCLVSVGCCCMSAMVAQQLCGWLCAAPACGRDSNGQLPAVSYCAHAISHCGACNRHASISSSSSSSTSGSKPLHMHWGLGECGAADDGPLGRAQHVAGPCSAGMWFMFLAVPAPACTWWVVQLGYVELPGLVNRFPCERKQAMALASLWRLIYLQHLGPAS
jgi:hypothetical protein